VLVRIDALLHMSVVATATNPPILNVSDLGKSWIVGAAATGEWMGQDLAVATWSGADWDFFRPTEGMAVWDQSNSVELRYVDGIWQSPSAVPSPQDGAVIDTEARSAITQLLTQLRLSGIIGQ